MQKEPNAHFLIHMSIELEVNVLEEIPWGTRPRVGTEMGKREKASRAAYGPPDHSQGSVTGDIHSCLSFTVPR